MNYLSHYYCDFPEERPYYVLGLILPDLVRELEGKKMRFIPAELPDDSDNPIFRQLNQGISRHLEVDLHWHNSSFFFESVERIKLLLESCNFESIPNRIFVFAHVLLELLIDRVLIKADRQPMEKFYTTLEMVEKEPIMAFFQEHGQLKRPEAVFERVRFFCKDRFLYRYPDNEMMLFALNVLNQKVGNSVITKDDESMLLDCIQEIESFLDADGLSIFDQLRISNDL